METRARIAEAMLSSGKLAEVLRGLRYNFVVELKYDTARGLFVNGDVELIGWFIYALTRVGVCTH